MYLDIYLFNSFFPISDNYFQRLLLQTNLDEITICSDWITYKIVTHQFLLLGWSNEGADWRRQFRNKIYSADQLELYEEAARVNKEPQNLPNLENFTFSLRFPGDYQNAKIFSQEGWATFNIKDLKIVFSWINILSKRGLDPYL